MHSATSIAATGLMAIASLLIVVTDGAAQGVLPPARDQVQKEDAAKGILPPITRPEPDARKDTTSTDKLDSLKELDKGSAAGGLLAHQGYKFPGLNRAILDGRLEEVPDDQTTRAVVFSIIKGHADFCGPTPADVAMHAMPYASELARQIYRNPAEGGLKVLEEIAKSIVKGQREDPMAGIEDFLRKHGVVFQDGVDDARILVDSGHRCTGEEQTRFYANLSRLVVSRSRREPAAYDEIKFWELMSPAYRRLHNIPDPALELARRKSEALKKTALQSCQSRFDRPTFCDCAVKKLDGIALSDNQWSMLSNFRAVATLGKDRGDVAQAIRSCF